MGRVYRALDTRLGRTVALKVLSRDQVGELDTLMRFRNKAQSAARLNHESIAQVYYLGEDAGLPFIAFEFIQGVNVRDLARIQGDEVTPEILKDHGLIGTLRKPVKILGMGEVEGAFQVSAHAFSGTARTKIEAAGGTVTVVDAAADEVPEALEVAEEVIESEEAPAPEGDEASEAEDEKA